MTYFKDYKRAMVKNQASKMIKVGSAVREAREEGSDPVEAFVKAAPAYNFLKGKWRTLPSKKQEVLRTVILK